MERIIFFCYGYEGKNSKNAIAICIHNIVSRMENKKEILVITGGVDSANGMSIIEGVEIYYIPKKSTDTKKNLQNYKENALKIVDEIYSSQAIRIIFNVSFQFVNLEIGYEIKKKYPDIIFWVYELDPYSYNDALRWPSLAFPFRYFKERKVFNVADKIFLTKELFTLYKNNVFKSFSNKFIELGIPMLEVRKDELANKDNSECRIVFTGALAREYRNPAYMLKLFSLIKDKGDWTLHIYGSDGNTIDDQDKKLLEGKLFIHDKVSREEILLVIKEASLLINIGNSMSHQLPSKLLDYIGFRKPIINIYKNHDDVCNQYLTPYPLKVLIREENNNIEANALKLLSFIESNYNRICSYEEVNTNFKDLTIDAIVQTISNEIATVKKYENG